MRLPSTDYDERDPCSYSRVCFRIPIRIHNNYGIPVRRKQ